MNKVLSDIITYTKYAKYIPSLKRRETWDEIVDRYLRGMIRKFPHLQSEILANGEFIRNQKILPSMRFLQFAGDAVERNEVRGYNCSYVPVTSYEVFSEIMFLLLAGTGVGYSVQTHHIEELPTILKPTRERKFLVGDSIEGWADAVKILLKSYFGLSQYKPRFDFSDIRPKGTLLVTTGGKAPGPDPLRICLLRIETILNKKENGDQLSALECHDIICHIADSVLTGGIRRAALISLFSIDDKEMATCKYGEWWELNPQRGRANNSAVFLRSRASEEDFLQLWNIAQESKAGEPGILFTNDPKFGTNPCGEISLRPYSFCNLTEINASNLDSESDFYERCEKAAFFGTLQAGFTDFHYLRPIWKKSTEKDYLIGVGITGICNGNILQLRDQFPDLLKKGAQVVKQVNKEVAESLGILPAARCTTIKPAGTTSSLLGVSSGIHAWHSKVYIRNIQCAIGDDLYNYFAIKHPKLIKIMDYDPRSAVIGIPMKAPEQSILREKETAIDLLERIKMFNLEWVREGHRQGPNYNNVSATVNIRDTEWEQVRKWIWENRYNYNGLAILPYDNGTYRDAPFEVCTEEEYEEKLKYVTDIDLTQITEDEDNTAIQQEIACGGVIGCEVVL